MIQPLVIAKDRHLNDVVLHPEFSNRHGLITGATGTGKTVTLQKITEIFSQIGVPVFLSDVKGDLSGLAEAGELSPKLQSRLENIGITDWVPRAVPVEFWDIYGELGHPIRATISDMGPILLARLLNVNETQSALLQIIYKIAEDKQFTLVTLQDLRTFTQHVGENAKAYTTQYGNITTASIGAIQRGLFSLEQLGGDIFFGEPMLSIYDLIKTNANGEGVVNILAAEKLYHSPKLYATFLLWLLNKLFEQLPEVGDLDKPKMVFFFDEAHLLFNDAPAVLLQKIEHIVRLIRSKGIGVFFVTQNPLDIPDSISSQLGNRIQHALRAFTPKEQKAVKAAATTLRANPDFNTEAVLTTLSVGEALISLLNEKGQPSIVEQTSVIAPYSRMGIISEDKRRQLINGSLFYGQYNSTSNKVSASDFLAKHAAENQKEESNKAEKRNPISDFLLGSSGPRGGKKDGVVQMIGKTVTRRITNEISRYVTNMLGGIVGKKRK